MSTEAILAGGWADRGVLRPRLDSGLPLRLARSAVVAREGRWSSTAATARWLAELRLAGNHRVERIPFAALDGWSFRSDTGDLVHRTGRFFSVAGLRVDREGETPVRWEQPIIDQPEVGILGILAKEFDGILHFLLQAKMEPGNPNLVQLSPTVQATRSNYTLVHAGAAVRYLEHFVRADSSTTLVDVLQSEHGAWFLDKANRNMIVETTAHVPVHDGFRWLTLGQIGQLLLRDNVVNMDTRSVLACAPTAHDGPAARHSDADLLSWFTAERAPRELRSRRVPLAGISGWTRDDTSIGREDGRHFRVVAARVQAGDREVGAWSQPLFEPVDEGVCAFAIRWFGGVPHVLVHARREAGFPGSVQLGPTLQYIPANYAGLDETELPAFHALAAPSRCVRVLYDARHSEEGGRFLGAVNRCLVVEADEAQAPSDPPAGYRWASLGQLSALGRHANYLNIQARTLLAAINSGCVAL